MITAKHVLSEGVFRTQRPRSISAPSSPFVPNSSTQPKLDPDHLKAVWGGARSVALLNVASVEYNDSLDIACGLVFSDKLDQGEFQPAAIPIDTTVPSQGDVVHMVSMTNMSAFVDKKGADKKGIGSIMSIRSAVSIRVGVVTKVYPKGFRQFRWPCFTTSIPAEPGMSGGLVTIPKDGTTVGACGIVCADTSTDAARGDQSECGESIVASAWVALGMRLPESLPLTKSTAKVSLLDFMRRGDLPMAVGGIDQIQIVPSEDGNYSISIQSK